MITPGVYPRILRGSFPAEGPISEVGLWWQGPGMTDVHCSWSRLLEGGGGVGEEDGDAEVIACLVSVFF